MDLLHVTRQENLNEKRRERQHADWVKAANDILRQIDKQQIDKNPGDNSPLVVDPSWTTDAGVWGMVVDRLLQDGFRVLDGKIIAF